MTGFDQMDSPVGRFNFTNQLPLTPEEYYGAYYNIVSNEWRGGEVVYNTGDNKLYIQTAQSGRTPAWKATGVFEIYP